MIKPGVLISGRTVPSLRCTETVPSRGPKGAAFSTVLNNLNLSVVIALRRIDEVVWRPGSAYRSGGHVNGRVASAIDYVGALPHFGEASESALSQDFYSRALGHARHSVGKNTTG